MKRTLLCLFGSIFIISAGYAYCPATGNCQFNVFIDDFTFNTISRINSQGSNCTTTSYIYTGMSTSVTKGLTYTLTVQCGPQYAQGVGIWIDYNQDDDFDDNGEFVWSSAFASLITFVDSFTIPVTALTGVTRMRVRSKWNATFTAGESCGSVTWGEIEDYDIDIQPNTVPPIANFTASTTNTCSGDVSFFDLSANTPTAWTWDFGDSNGSILQNPTHVYTGSGIYTVTLTSENAWGQDTKVEPNYITVNLGSGPIPASCLPTTSAWCCGFGITDVQFNTINNSSQDGSADYQDFTCSQTTITAGVPYNISITTATPSEHNVRVWIDYNNSGSFSAGELAFTADQVLTTSGDIIAPTNAVLNTPLRMRISADYYLNPVPSPCLDPQVGQVEDYTVIIEPNVNLPVAAFIADTFSCSGAVQFTDQSINAPTFWQWNFGDGNFSTFQNPLHTYSNSGTYTVKLIAMNVNGNDTVEYIDYITVDLSAFPTSTCNVITLAHCCNYGIYNVTLNTINNITAGGEDGYMDYSCTQTTSVVEGTSYNIQINTGLDNPEDVTVWIDYNDDGVLDDIQELAFSSINSLSHSGTVNVPMGAVKYTPLRMRVSADYSGSNLNPCDDSQWSQIEDYGVIITGPPPVALFTSDSTVICLGTINFQDQSTQTPTAWYWDFGDANNSTQQNPTHTYSSYGTYNVKLRVTSIDGSDSLTQNNYIVYDSCLTIVVPKQLIDGTLLIYPNPTSELFNIEYQFDGIKELQIQLTDVIGQTIHSKKQTAVGTYKQTLNLSGTEKGVYFLTIDNGKQRITRKIVLN